MKSRINKLVLVLSAALRIACGIEALLFEIKERNIMVGTVTFDFNEELIPSYDIDFRPDLSLKYITCLNTEFKEYEYGDARDPSNNLESFGRPLEEGGSPYPGQGIVVLCDSQPRYYGVWKHFEDDMYEPMFSEGVVAVCYGIRNAFHLP